MKKRSHKESTEKYREYTRNYNAKRRQSPEVREQRRRYSRLSLLAHYGLTPEDFDLLMEKQGGVCAICERPSKTRSLDIDHEHQKKEKHVSPESRKERVRGLLCHRCNRALGLFGNDMELLLLASKNFAEYIEEYYAKRLIGELGLEEAKRIMGNAVNYFERYEARIREVE